MKKAVFRKIFALFLLVLLTGLFSGCNTVDTYINMLGEETAQQAQDIADGKTVSGSINARTTLADATLSFCNAMKSITVIMAPASFIIGFLGVIIFRKTVWIRKGCTFVLMIAVPVTLVVITYGSAFLASWFLN